MLSKASLIRVAVAAIVGAGGALAFPASSASASAYGGGCEQNLCFSDGNCDLSDFPTNCKETGGGCEASGCVLN